jgi:hypothetical protein
MQPISQSCSLSSFHLSNVLNIGFILQTEWPTQPVQMFLCNKNDEALNKNRPWGLHYSNEEGKLVCFGKINQRQKTFNFK